MIFRSNYIYLIFLENTKPPSKPPKGQICPVLTVGWLMLAGFVVEGWKSDFCDSLRVKIGLFPIIKV